MRDLQELVSINRRAAKKSSKPGYRRPSCPDIIAGADSRATEAVNARRNAYVRHHAGQFPSVWSADECPGCADEILAAGSVV